MGSFLTSPTIQVDDVTIENDGGTIEIKGKKFYSSASGEITGLQDKTHYKVIFHALNGSATDLTLNVKINGNAASHRQLLKADETTVSTLESAGILQTTSASGLPLMIEGDIAVIDDGTNKQVIGIFKGINFYGDSVVSLGGFDYTVANTTAIESIEVYALTSTITIKKMYIEEWD